MKHRVSYPKEMRDIAESQGKKLVTIDLPFMTYQSPATEAEVNELHDFWLKWYKEKSTTSAPQQIEVGGEFGKSLDNVC